MHRTQKNLKSITERSHGMKNHNDHISFRGRVTVTSFWDSNFSVLAPNFILKDDSEEI